MHAYDASTIAGFEVRQQLLKLQTKPSKLDITNFIQVKDLLLPENTRELGLMVRKKFEMDLGE